MSAHWMALVVVAGFISSAAYGQSRAVYRCELDGQLIFSDRPCAPSAQMQRLEATPINVYEAPDQPASLPRASPAPSRNKPTEDPAAELDKRKQTCERLALGLRETRSKLRAGYKPSQGEKLKARQERLKAQMRIARCG